ncbi:MAG: hypothetical protein D6675_02195 [Gemmatimonadetes bacterium]|nr:MAG: hypothetical protein D6675_02195 [Gemmatimonadota bacterium]
MRKLWDKLLKGESQSADDDRSKSVSKSKKQGEDSKVKKMSPSELKRLEYAQKFQEKLKESQSKIEEKAQELEGEDPTQILTLPFEEQNVVDKLIDIIDEVCSANMFKELAFDKKKDVSIKEDKLLTERLFDDTTYFDSLYIQLRIEIPMNTYRGAERLAINPTQLSREISTAIQERSGISVIMDTSKPRTIKSRRMVDKRQKLETKQMSVTEWRQKRRQVDNTDPEDMLESEYYTKSLILIYLYFPRDFWQNVEFTEVTAFEELQESQELNFNTSPASASATPAPEPAAEVEVDTGMSYFREDEPDYGDAPVTPPPPKVEPKEELSPLSTPPPGELEFKDEPDIIGDEESIEIEIPGLSAFGDSSPDEDYSVLDPHVRQHAGVIRDDSAPDTGEVDEDFDLEAAESIAQAEMEHQMEDSSEIDPAEDYLDYDDDDMYDEYDDDEFEFTDEIDLSGHSFGDGPDPQRLAEIAEMMKGGKKETPPPGDEPKTVEIQAIAPEAVTETSKKSETAKKPPKRLTPPKKLIPIPEEVRQARLQKIQEKKRKMAELQKQAAAKQGKKAKLSPEQRRQFLEWMKKQAEEEKENPETGSPDETHS